MGPGVTKMNASASNRVDAMDSGGDGDETESNKIYHERQVRELCAMHTLNNLLQDGSAFSQRDLDKICDQLTPSWSWWNPHRSMLGTGNYDVNVIMVALKQRSYDVIWFDKRRDVSCIKLEAVEGFILNAPSGYKIGGIIPLGLSRKHWYTVRQIDTNYYNLDSKLKKPDCIGDSESLMLYLHTQLSCRDKELLVVVKDGVVPYQSQGEATLDSTQTLQPNSSADPPGINYSRDGLESNSTDGNSDPKQVTSQINNSDLQKAAHNNIT